MMNDLWDRHARRQQPGSSEPLLNAPSVVLVLLAAFVAIHVIRSFLSEDADIWTLLTFAFIPARYVYPASEFPGGVGAQVWTFVTHLFLHGSWTHLLVNCFWMLAFGTVVARRLGAVGFLILSAICGIAGATLHLLIYWGELSPVIGASAAISGQMAAAIRLMFAGHGGIMAATRMDPRYVRPLSLAETFAHRGALGFIVIWFGINILFGVLSFGAGEGGAIAWQAHIGGFLAGLLCFGPVDRWVQRSAD